MISLNSALSLVCVTALGGITALGPIHPDTDDHASVLPVTTIDQQLANDPWMDVIMSDRDELEGLVGEAFLEAPIDAEQAQMPSWAYADAAPSLASDRRHQPTPEQRLHRSKRAGQKRLYAPLQAALNTAKSRGRRASQSGNFFERSRQYDRTKRLNKRRSNRNDRRVNQSRIIMPGRIGPQDNLTRNMRSRKPFFEQTRQYARTGSAFSSKKRGRRNRYSSQSRNRRR